MIGRLVPTPPEPPSSSCSLRSTRSPRSPSSSHAAVRACNSSLFASPTSTPFASVSPAPESASYTLLRSAAQRIHGLISCIRKTLVAYF